MSKDFIEDTIYPLTITADRYNGAYSGGKFIAWNLLAEDIPEGTEGDDCDCYSFWLDNEIICGKGSTVSEALADLYVKLKGGGSDA
jgi:hypothetical protein